MALKDILVHIDNGRHCTARLDAALALAAAHDAHLTGLYVITHPRIPGYVRAQLPDDLIAQQERATVAAAARAERTFTDHLQRAGINGEWRCVEGAQAPMLSMHGRYADVVVAGQRDTSGDEGVDDPAMPDQLILGLGRPVLVIPYGGEFPAIGNRVLVAWDASRLATRAINDAMPFLETAKEVIVLAVNPKREDGEGGHGEIPSADICLHLARHRIRTEAQHLYADDLSAGEVLLSRAVDEGIDLIVCGAYGHARWRELVLGGVTRHLLEHMTIPVLMSH
ncbi:MAG: universal stress protein [Rhodospirillales bacterium]|nr:universal stress protein [Rhodospirillales bacterium]